MNVEKTVYFVRHAQSLANISAVFQAPDSPLSEIGRRQARCVACRISRLSCEALITSPFCRAMETAEAIAAKTGLKPERSELFVERLKPSAINGKPIDDREAQVIWTRWEQSLYTPSMRVEDGENFDDVIARAGKALLRLSEREETSLVVVTHGFFLRTMVARVVLGEALTAHLFRRFQRMAPMDNTGLTVLHFHGGLDMAPEWRLWIYNDHAHLGESEMDRADLRES
jgi:broad specificity phosphatase PhoE